MVTRHCADWHHICSFVGPCGIEKDDFLCQLGQYIPADDYVMVGNILGVSGASDDRGAAQRAGWRFIQERDFAKRNAMNGVCACRASGRDVCRERSIWSSTSRPQGSRPDDHAVAAAAGGRGNPVRPRESRSI